MLSGTDNSVVNPSVSDPGAVMADRRLVLRSTTGTSVAVTAGVAMLLLAACGSNSPSTASPASSTPGSPPAAQSSAESAPSADTSAGGSSASAAGGSSASAAGGGTLGSVGSGAASSSSASPAGGSSGSGAASPSAGPAGSLGAECSPAQLKTTTPNLLTIATSEPAYEPWMVANDPTNGKGFESAVAYAVADRLGYPKDKVRWKRVGFDEAIVKQEGWDFDINQFSIDDKRKKVVDFSSGYYDVSQTVITVKGSPLDGATTVAAIKKAKLGAMNGTTSLNAVNDVIQPAQKPSVFDDNALAAQALQSGQIDGLVVDLPTAFYIANAQLKDGVIVGQLPGTANKKEQFGLLLAKGSPVTACATKVVDALRADGTLAKLTKQWLGGKDAAPALK